MFKINISNGLFRGMARLGIDSCCAIIHQIKSKAPESRLTDPFAVVPRNYSPSCAKMAQYLGGMKYNMPFSYFSLYIIYWIFESIASSKYRLIGKGST